MKNTIKILGIIVLTAVIIFSMAACNRGSSAGAADSSDAEAPVLDAGSIESILAEYEKLVNEAAPVLHRIATGDTMAVIELSAVQEQIEAIKSKLEDFSETDLTQEQIEKIAELGTRMLGVAGE